MQPDPLYHATPAAAALSALSSDAAMNAPTAQRSHGLEHTPETTKTRAYAQAADKQQHVPQHTAAVLGEQAAKGLPRCNSDLLQTVPLCGLEAVTQSKQDWSQLATQTYQACVWTFAQTARQYVTCNAEKQNIHSMPDVQPQLLFIGEQ